MIFNSLGSNFASLRQAINPALVVSNPTDSEELKNYLEKRYRGEAILLYKGREALELALKLSRLPVGSYVAINGFTCYAVYEAVVDAGFKVEYLDIEDNSLDFSSDVLTKAIGHNPDIKAVIIQNSLGFPADVPAIKKVCAAHQIVLIEDLAHSLGTIYNSGEEAGTIGDFTVLSFSQDKIIDSISGGALIVRNREFALGLSKIMTKKVPRTVQRRDRLHPFFTWIIRHTYSLKIGKAIHRTLDLFKLLSKPMNDLGPGFHTLPDWQSKLSLAQLKALSQTLKHRQHVASIYMENLPKDTLLNISSDLVLQSSCLRFPILVSDRQKLLVFLKKKNFHLSDIWYDAPIGPAKYLKLTSYSNQCPSSEKITERIVNLPTHLSINGKQAKNLAELITVCQK